MTFLGQLWLLALIQLGGIGIVTLAIEAVGAVLLWFSWRDTLGNAGAVWPAVFHATSAFCNAGFNTVDYEQISNSSLVLTLAPMWIGGSPGSTAGGVKTTTAALLALLFLSRLRGRDTVSFANRSVPDATVQRAVGLAVGGILLLFTFVFALLFTEIPSGSVVTDRESFVHLVFEAQSALGTVGLWMNKTTDLSPAGRVLIVMLMFLGREDVLVG